MEDTQLYPEELKDLPADRIVGPYLTLHPEFCFVVEDDQGIVGYACASPDYKKFRIKQELAWIPEMCLKYPILDSNKNLTKFAQVFRIKKLQLYSYIMLFLFYRKAYHTSIILKMKCTLAVLHILLV